MYIDVTGGWLCLVAFGLACGCLFCSVMAALLFRRLP